MKKSTSIFYFWSSKINSDDISHYICRETKLIEGAKALKVNAGTEPDADLGPVISRQVCESVFIFSMLDLN